MRAALAMGMQKAAEGEGRGFLSRSIVRMSGGWLGLYRRGGASDSTNLDVIIGFDEQQLLVQLSHRNLINRKGFILCHHSPVNANVLLSLF